MWLREACSLQAVAAPLKPVAASLFPLAFPSPLFLSFLYTNCSLSSVVVEADSLEPWSRVHIRLAPADDAFHARILCQMIYQSRQHWTMSVSCQTVNSQHQILMH